MKRLLNDKQEDWFVHNYPHMHNEDIANTLCVSVPFVRNYACNLRLRKSPEILAQVRRRGAEVKMKNKLEKYENERKQID